MRELNEKHVYDLSELTSEERKELLNYLAQNFNNWVSSKEFHENHCLYFDDYGNTWFQGELVSTHNAKELFYTFENIQVDCRVLTEEHINRMKEVVIQEGYTLWNHKIAFELNNEVCYFVKNETDNDFLLSIFSENKTTITYEKFMELFGSEESNFKKLVDVLNEELTEEAYKETEYEVKYIAEKPKQYQIGIDTFNPQPHYNNENGSLYKIATDLGLNHWEFDIFKRLVRCRKKNQFKEDLQKIKDTIDIYLNEYSKDY